MLEKLLAHPGVREVCELRSRFGFMAFHETYHVGQTSYLRRWLGHEGVAG